MDIYKHYIRMNVNSIVVYGFSDAFEQPLETDILIESDSGRHYNPQLTNDQGQYIYKYANSQMVLRTDDEMFDLLEYKQVKIDLLSGYRDVDLESGFASTVIRDSVALEFSYTEKAQTRFMKQLAIVGANPSLNTIDWLTTNGGFVTLTRDEFISITNSGAAHEITIEFKFLYAQANIMNALDKDAVDLIFFGW